MLFKDKVKDKDNRFRAATLKAYFTGEHNGLVLELSDKTKRAKMWSQYCNCRALKT